MNDMLQLNRNMRSRNNNNKIRDFKETRNSLTVEKNKAGYTAIEVACGWAGAVFEVTRAFGQEQWGKKKS